MCFSRVFFFGNSVRSGLISNTIISTEKLSKTSNASIQAVGVPCRFHGDRWRRKQNEENSGTLHLPRQFNDAPRAPMPDKKNVHSETRHSARRLAVHLSDFTQSRNINE